MVRESHCLERILVVLPLLIHYCFYSCSKKFNMDGGFVRATSDNLPRVDSLMLLEFASKAEEYISAEIRNIKSDG